MSLPHFILALTWDPGIRSILVVAVGILVLCGSVFLLLTTNLGHRLGFLVALSGIFGILTMLGIVWTILGVGIKGRPPVWVVREVVVGNPNQARLGVARSLPLVTDFPDPKKLIEQHHLQSAFANQTRPPNLSDVVDADPGVVNGFKGKLGGWRLLGTSNAVASDASSTASQYLTTTSTAPKFAATTDFVVLGTFDKGGKPAPGNSSIGHSVVRRIEDTAMFLIGDNPTHYAVVQIQPAVPQVAQPGESPPIAQPDASQPVYSIVMIRDLGTLREPSAAVFFFSLIATLICLATLHRRDKRAMAARAAAAAAAESPQTPVSAGV
jgi:hypothetical protein